MRKRPRGGAAHDAYAKQIEEIEKRLDINPDQAAEFALQKAKGNLLINNGNLDKMQKIWQTTLGDLAKLNVDLAGIEEAELQKAEKEIQERDSTRLTQANEELGKAVEKQLNAKEAKAAAETQAVKDVEKALKDITKMIETGGTQWLIKTAGNQLGDLTNSWKAWGKNILGTWPQFADTARSLQKYLTVPAKGTLEPDYAAARKLWRGEMVQFLADKLGAHSESVSSETDLNKQKNNALKFEKILAAQKVPAKERTVKRTVDAAQKLDGALKKGTDRQRIIAAMETGKEAHLDFKDDGKSIFNLFPELADSGKIQVLAGDRLVNVPVGYFMESAMTLEHLALDGNRLYGQVKNGCEGNLVIIDVTRK